MKELQFVKARLHQARAPRFPSRCQHTTSPRTLGALGIQARIRRLLPGHGNALERRKTGHPECQSSQLPAGQCLSVIVILLIKNWSEVLCQGPSCVCLLARMRARSTTRLGVGSSGRGRGAYDSQVSFHTMKAIVVKMPRPRQVEPGCLRASSVMCKSSRLRSQLTACMLASRQLRASVHKYCLA